MRADGHSRTVRGQSPDGHPSPIGGVRCPLSARSAVWSGQQTVRQYCQLERAKRAQSTARSPRRAERQRSAAALSLVRQLGTSRVRVRG